MRRIVADGFWWHSLRWGVRIVTFQSLKKSQLGLLILLFELKFQSLNLKFCSSFLILCIVGFLFDFVKLLLKHFALIQDLIFHLLDF